MIVDVYAHFTVATVTELRGIIYLVLYSLMMISFCPIYLLS